MSDDVADEESGKGSSGAYVPKHSRGGDGGTHGGGGGAKPHRSAARKVLIGINIVVALTLVASGLGVGYAVWQLNQISRVHLSDIVPVGHDPQSQAPTTGASNTTSNSKTPPTTAAPVASGPPETFLIVGSDTRAGLDQPGDKAYGTAQEVSGARSDTIMLARVVPGTKQIALLSIPRDTYLDIPGLGMQKINSALGVSPNLLVKVIEQEYGLDINHYIDVDFDSFKDIADALGGVQVYFPTPVRDVNAGLYIGTTTGGEVLDDVPGCVNLTGALALAFVRSREYTYYIPGEGWIQEAQSDLARIQRQQIFIRKLAAKAQSEGLGNPITLTQIISGLTKNLTVDDTLSDGDLVNLAATFRHINPAKIVGWTMPASAETLQTSSGPDDVLVPEASADKAMVAQFLAFGENVPTPAPAPVDLGGTTPSGTTTSTTRPSRPTTTKGRGTTTSTSSTSTIPASSIEVTVVNGSDIAGQAGRTATSLRGIGFDVVGTEDGTYGHTSTEVEYGPGGLAAAQTVAAHLEGSVVLQATSGLGAHEVQVVTGTALSGIRATVTQPSGSSGSSGAKSTTTASSTSTSTSTVPPTTVPATTTTTYVLPGTPKSGAPSCPS
jgi:LCP family protein required for cell wall assembly